MASLEHKLQNTVPGIWATSILYSIELLRYRKPKLPGAAYIKADD
jgi:hypothetical protein